MLIIYEAAGGRAGVVEYVINPTLRKKINAAKKLIKNRTGNLYYNKLDNSQNIVGIEQINFKKINDFLADFTNQKSTITKTELDTLKDYFSRIERSNNVSRKSLFDHMQKDISKVRKDANMMKNIKVWVDEANPGGKPVKLKDITDKHINDFFNEIALIQHNGQNVNVSKNYRNLYSFTKSDRSVVHNTGKVDESSLKISRNPKRARPDDQQLRNDRAANNAAQNGDINNRGGDNGGGDNGGNNGQPPAGGNGDGQVAAQAQRQDVNGNDGQAAAQVPQDYIDGFRRKEPMGWGKVLGIGAAGGAVGAMVPDYESHLVFESYLKSVVGDVVRDLKPGNIVDWIFSSKVGTESQLGKKITTYGNNLKQKEKLLNEIPDNFTSFNQKISSDNKFKENIKELFTKDTIENERDFELKIRQKISDVKYNLNKDVEQLNRYRNRATKKLKLDPEDEDLLKRYDENKLTSETDKNKAKVIAQTRDNLIAANLEKNARIAAGAAAAGATATGVTILRRNGNEDN